MTISFQDKLDIEQIRSMEERGGPLEPYDNPAAIDDFESWLALRARQLKRKPEVKATLHRGAQWYFWLTALLTLAAATIGITTTARSLTDTGQVLNIFWVLALLLGFNLVSLLLWIIFTVMMRDTRNGIVAPLADSVLHRFLSRHGSPVTTAANGAWLRIHFEGPAGRWHLGRLTHWVWMAYVLGGWLWLLILLATRQFDFVWESTLLGGEAFVDLTRTLATPIAHLGLPTPSETQILASQTGATLADPEATRRTWGLFLLSCLLLYGLLPRLLAWLLCYMQERRLQNRYRLKLSEPYYLTLQQQLWPAQQAGRVIDEDHSPPQTGPGKAATATPAQIPKDAIYIGVELRQGVAAQYKVDNIVDPPGLQRSLQRLQVESTRPLAIFAEAARPPDRGTLRIIRQLMAQRPPAQCWLALHAPAPGITAEQQQNWAKLVSVAGVSPTHVMPVNVYEH